MAKPPRYKQAPKGPSKLRLRMQANKANRQANKAQKNTDRIVRPDLDRIKTTVDRTNNESSLKENIDVKKTTTSFKLPENEGLKLDTSTSPSFTLKSSAVDPKDITSIAMEGKGPNFAKIGRDLTKADQDQSDRDIRRAYSDYASDSETDLMRTGGGGFKYNNNTFTRDASGAITYTSEYTSPSGEVTTTRPQPMRNLGTKNIQSVHKERMRMEAENFMKGDAAKVYMRKAGGHYDEKTGKVSQGDASHSFSPLRKEGERIKYYQDRHPYTK
tara:strand:- start:179 stop:994 length:816 start_codon:yes stop_codon:yes gene_type:complete